MAVNNYFNINLKSAYSSFNQPRFRLLIKGVLVITITYLAGKVLSKIARSFVQTSTNDHIQVSKLQCKLDNCSSNNTSVRDQYSILKSLTKTKSATNRIRLGLALFMHQISPKQKWATLLVETILDHPQGNLYFYDSNVYFLSGFSECGCSVHSRLKVSTDFLCLDLRQKFETKLANFATEKTSCQFLAFGSGGGLQAFIAIARAIRQKTPPKDITVTLCDLSYSPETNNHSSIHQMFQLLADYAQEHGCSFTYSLKKTPPDRQKYDAIWAIDFDDLFKNTSTFNQVMDCRTKLLSDQGRMYIVHKHHYIELEKTRLIEFYTHHKGSSHPKQRPLDNWAEIRRVRLKNSSNQNSTIKLKDEELLNCHQKPSGIFLHDSEVKKFLSLLLEEENVVITDEK
ncbi:MAG: hypothetical protein AAF443_07050 [Chlamydiota bacterium]